VCGPGPAAVSPLAQAPRLRPDWRGVPHICPQWLAARYARLDAALEAIAADDARSEVRAFMKRGGVLS
jgi:hypothetical protein